MMTHWIAERLRRLADRIDYRGSPKCTSWSFTFESGRGAVLNQDGRGCRLWYLGDASYDRAYSEAADAPPRVNWAALSASRNGARAMAIVSTGNNSNRTYRIF